MDVHVCHLGRHYYTAQRDAGTADALKAFFMASCKSETVEPPLSTLFPPADDFEPVGNTTEAPTCHGTMPASLVGPTPVCRDRFGLLEAAYGQAEGSMNSNKTRNGCGHDHISLLALQTAA